MDKNLGYTFSSHPLSFNKLTFIGQFFIRCGTFGFCFSFRVHMFYLGDNKAGKRVKYEGKAHALSLLEDLLICHSIEE